MEKNKEKYTQFEDNRKVIIRDFMQSMHTNSHYTHKFMATLSKKMEINISHESMQILDIIANHSDGITIRQICDINLKSRMLNWKLIKNLEDDGLVEKRENKMDKRTPLLFLTNKGLKFIQQKISKGTEVFSMMLNDFSEEEIIQFTSFFKRMINNIGELVNELDSEEIVHDSVYEIIKEM